MRAIEIFMRAIKILLRRCPKMYVHRLPCSLLSHILTQTWVANISLSQRATFIYISKIATYISQIATDCQHISLKQPKTGHLYIYHVTPIRVLACYMSPFPVGQIGFVAVNITFSERCKVLVNPKLARLSVHAPHSMQNAMSVLWGICTRGLRHQTPIFHINTYHAVQSSIL